jgi:hypothetical protein
VFFTEIFLLLGLSTGTAALPGESDEENSYPRKAFLGSPSEEDERQYYLYTV